MSDEDKSLGERNYDQFAERYAKRVPTKPHNAYYDRPAVQSLLPDVNGLMVLDAGCGSGIYAEWLLDRGASVVGFDVTAEMVRIAQENVGDRAEILRHDLTQPLDFAESDQFDLVICPLVLDYIEDWVPVFKEFKRVLKSGGTVVYSVSHPASEFFVYHPDGNYFDVEQVQVTWGGFGRPRPVITLFRRSFSEVINPVLEAGLTLDHVLEPTPTQQFKASDPIEYDYLIRSPGFICVRAKKG